MKKTYNKIYFDKDEPAGGLTEEDFTDLFGDIDPSAENEDLLNPPTEGEELEDQNNTETSESEESTAKAPEGQELADEETDEESSEEKPKGETAGTVTETDTSESDETQLSEMEMLRINNERLIKMVNDLSGGKPAEAPAKPEESLPPINFEELFKDFDFDKVVDTKEGFIDFFTKAMSTVQSQTAASLMQTLPKQIQGTVQQHSSLQEVHNEFYTAHPELSAVKKYVGQVASGIASAEPELSVQEVLVKTATQVKEQLGLSALPAKDSATPPPSGTKPKAKLPGSSSTRKPSPSKSNLQSEIDELLTE